MVKDSGAFLCLWRVKQDSCLISLPLIFYPGLFQGGDGRITGKALQIEQGSVRKPIANKIDLTLFPSSLPSMIFNPLPAKG